MPPEAIIILYKEETSLDTKLASLTRFFGIPCKAIRLSDERNREGLLTDNQTASCIMVRSFSLERWNICPIREEVKPNFLATSP